MQTLVANAAVLVLVLSVAGPGAAGSGAREHDSPEATPSSPRASLPFDFIENRGQWAPATRFVAGRAALAASLECDRIRLRLGKDRPASLVLAFEGASRAATLLGEDPRSGRYNFFLGNDPARWR